MSDSGDARLVATLWRLSMKDDRLACLVYRERGGLQLTVESPTAVIVTEPFEVQPRALARARALCSSLKRRGWHDDTPR